MPRRRKSRGFRVGSRALAPLAGLLGGLLLIPGAQAQEAQPKPPRGRTLTRIRHQSEPRSTRVVVEGDGPLAYAYSSPDAWSAVVELAGCDASALPGRIEVNSPEVERVRIETGPGADGAGRVRIEVSLKGPFYHRVFPRGNDLHLVFERPPAEPKTTPAPDDPLPRPAEPGSGPPPHSERSATTPASRILDVVADTEGDRLAVTVTADGHLLYEDFFVEAVPLRLVLDFAEVVIDPASLQLPVSEGVLLGVRVAQFSVRPRKIVRLILDLSSRPEYHIRERPDGVTVELEAPP